MKIKSQDGIEYTVHELETSGLMIKCRDEKDRRKKHVLGKYSSSKRVFEVFAEIYVANNNRVAEYIMPES